MYGNVGQEPKTPRALEERRKSGCSDVYVLEESEYEAVEPAGGLAWQGSVSKGSLSKPAWDQARGGDWDRAWSRGWSRGWASRSGVWAIGGLLALFVFLLLLLTLGATKYSAVQSENQRLRDRVCRPFLLYNEDHKLCAGVTRTERGQGRGALTAVPCDPGAPSQAFLWLQGGRLLSLAQGLCVGPSQRVNLAPLVLVPCGAAGLAWHCGEEALLGLRGQSLYFNYGNVASHLIVLFSGNRSWSRWEALAPGQVRHPSGSWDACSTDCHQDRPLCRPGWTPLGNRCYFFSSSLDAWAPAEAACVGLGARLLSISDPREQDRITKLLREQGTWLGQSGTPRSANSSSCMALLPKGTQVSWPCKDPLPWTCEEESF